jgi:hypothetical protein
MTSGAATTRRQMSETEQVAKLEAEIAHGRERMASSLGALQRQLHLATSWRHWVGAHPVAWICAGVCLGVIVGWRARRPCVSVVARL